MNEILVGTKLTKVKTLGNVYTQVKVGKIKEQVVVGSIEMDVGKGLTNVKMSLTSLTAKSTLVSIKARGAATFSAGASVTVKAGGLARVKGAVVNIAADGTTFAGGILTSGTINPMTGAPFYVSLCFGNPATFVT